MIRVRGTPVSSAAYSLLVDACLIAGRVKVAAAILERGLAMFPGDVVLTALRDEIGPRSVAGHVPVRGEQRWLLSMVGIIAG